MTGPRNFSIAAAATFGRTASLAVVGALVLLCSSAVGNAAEHSESPEGADARVAPSKIVVQGFLADSSGVAIDNEAPGVDFDVRLWDAETGGTELFLENITGVPVSQGTFTLKVGEGVALDPAIFETSPLYFGITVAGEAELPRTEVVSAPFAIRSRGADTADGVAPGITVTSINGVTDDITLVGGANVDIDVAGSTLTINASGGASDADWSVSGDDMSSLPSGNVGIGTPTPLSKLHITDGDNSVELILEADTNNGSGPETDHPVITMTQDGGALVGRLGFFGDVPIDNDLQLLHVLSGDTTKIALRSSQDVEVTSRNFSVIPATGQTSNIWLNGDVIVGSSEHYDFSADYIRFSARSEDWYAGVQNEATAADSDFFIGKSSAEDGTFHIENDGDVGIGTSTPQARLEVDGTVKVNDDLTISSANIEIQSPDADRAVLLTGDSLTGSAVSVNDGNEVEGAKLGASVVTGGGYLELSDGSTTQATVDIRARESSSAAGSIMFMYDDAGNKTIELDGFETTGGGGEIKLFDGTASAVKTVELDGNTGRVITKVLEITGGSDLSERFTVGSNENAAEPGMVVCIDPSRPGDLQISSRAYDRRVAGVISGAGGVGTGLLMGHSGTLADGEHPVALTGRVYCRVDASFGPIEPGDLLTTSPTPGYAMKVSDSERAQGAILGKAMTGLTSGRGDVLILVTLQ